MAKKIKKATPWFLMASILLVGLIVGLNSWIQNVKADTGAAGTLATVTNSAPEWTVNASESPDSTNASPTDVGSKVYFTAKASDPNGEQWYLAICKVSGAPTPAIAGPPTCFEGGGNNWIICGPYDDDHTIGAEECGYTTLVDDDESNVWYGYICDHHAGEAGSCNAVEQSTNDPFKVNHRPTITSVSTTADNQNPGGTFTITAVAEDTDTDGGEPDDTLTLYVCRTNAVSGVGCVTDQEVCHTIGDASPDVSCDYEDTAPTEDKAYTYFAFIWDNHGFAAADNSKTNTYTVANVAPVVSSVVLDDATNITLLNESSTTDIDVTGTVTDQNGCADIVLVSTKADIFTTDMVHGVCDEDTEDDNDDCYAEITCTRNDATCTGDGRDDDADADYTCTVSFQYHAQPTVTNTPWAAYIWTAFLNSADEALSDSDEAGTQVEMNDFVAFDVTASIAYGSLAVGEIAGGTALPQTTTVTATGNTALDLKLHAEKPMCTDYDTCVEDATHTPIAQSQQHYAASGDWTSGNALNFELPETAYQLDCKKSDTEDLTETEDVKWGLQVLDLTLSGSYTGSDTFTAVMGDNPEDTQW